MNFYNELNVFKRVNAIPYLLLFVCNPFICLCSCLFTIAKNSLYTRRDYRILFFMVALFMGTLAFTQKTSQGDIIRTYENIVNDSYAVQSIALEFGSSLFRLLNVFIYSLTGNVQYISLVWVTLIYYLVFLSIINIYDYWKRPYSNNIFIYLIGSIICFVIFTQVTEIMKQGVATSLFFYGYTSLINGRKIHGILPILLSFGIHGSSFFFLPIFLSLIVKDKKTLLILAAFSFFFRGFNLMVFVVQSFSGFSFLSSLTTLAESYSEQNMTNFFRSDSLYFSSVFFFYFASVLYVYAKQKNNSIFIKACLLMVIVLNLSYGVSHNFTRMLTMMFPFYIFLYDELCNNIVSRSKMISNTFLFVTFVFSFVLVYGRLAPSGGYFTSYMDNSLIKIVLSPLYFYLNLIAF